MRNVRYDAHMRKVVSPTTLGFILALGVASTALYLSPLGCAAPRAQEAQEGSQGMRVWNGERIQSFVHSGERICIPRGFEAVGAAHAGFGWASFPASRTGVLIESTFFKTETFSPPGSRYRISLRYPETTPESEAEAHRTRVERVATATAELFSDRGGIFRTPHTVLVTAGAETTAGLRVYPDPHKTLTVAVYEPEHIRSEELLIHAFVHLYNRHQPLNDYLENQSPIPASDFEEFEATWAETRLRETPAGRRERIEYLYNVHLAVRENDFSRIEYAPFNNRTQFEDITENAIVSSDAEYLDVQYGHYVLAPLAMVALDGLLRESGSQESVASFLHTIHQNPAQNFLALVTTELGLEGAEQFMNWINGVETVPRDLIDRALASY